MHTLIAIAWASARTTLSNRSALITRIGLYFIILVIFSRLWQVAVSAATEPLDAVALTWYLIITEWIVLSVPSIHIEIEREIQGGELGAQLLRPRSYPAVVTARALGQALVMALTLGIAGVLLGFFYTDAWPASAFALAAIPLGLIGITMLTLINVMTGLATVWLGECGPLFWVWHKSLFIFGGLLLPLSLYPAWLATFAWLTPFAPILNGPASLALSGTWLRATFVTGAQLLWLALILAAFVKMWRKVQSHLLIHGG